MNDEDRGQQVVAGLAWRYGVKSFDAQRRVPDETWRVLQESLRLAPSSFDLQPWRFLEVRTQATRELLAEAAPLNRAKISSCSHLLLLARRKSISRQYMDGHFERVLRQRGLAPTELQGFRDMVTHRIEARAPEAQAQWAALQTYVALGFVLSTAAFLRVDACAMEGIDTVAFDRIAGLQDSDYGVVVAVAMGYRSPADATQFVAKVRWEHDDVFTQL